MKSAEGLGVRETLSIVWLGPRAAAGPGERGEAGALARIAGVVYGLCLAFLAGGGGFLTFVAAPALAQGLGSRDAFARAVGAIFPRAFPAAIGASALLVLSALLMTRRRRTFGERGPSRWPVAAAILILVMNLYNGLVLLPEMQSLQGSIPSFEGPLTAARQRFLELHGLSFGLNLAVIALSAILLIARLAVI